MDKFWSIVSIIFLIGVFALLSSPAKTTVQFDELDTDCRYNKAEKTTVNVRNDEIYFSGQLFVENPETNLSYKFKKTSGKVVLNVKSSKVKPPKDFTDSCLGIAEFKAHTVNLRKGTYLVKLKINGEVKEKMVINIEQ